MAAGATYEPIATTTLGSAAASITFSSIPSTYTDLRLILTGNLSAGSFSYQGLQFNSDTGTNYSNTIIGGDGTTVSTISYTNVTSYRIGELPGATLGSTIIGTIQVDIFSYTGSTYKTALSASSVDANGSGWVRRLANLWRNTATVNSITLYDRNSYNYVAGTTATLYGIKAA